jgi:uncharacterized membrane protein
MTNFLFETFVYILALLGAVYLVLGLTYSIRRRIKSQNIGVEFILLVKNQEEYIEGIIRGIFVEEFLRDVITEDNFTVIDMGSNDDTLKILEKLKKDYQYINVVTFEEKDEIFKNFEEKNLSSLNAN